MLETVKQILSFMSAKINSKYLESYINEFTSKICDDYFTSRKYITGVDIIQLTPSIQVNYFIIKAIFEAWQLEVNKLKNNPYFDYRDNSVHHALIEFMNVLSRSIKIDRDNFEPLLNHALISSVFLASEPLDFFLQEMGKCEENQVNNFLKENKKYYKWHQELITNLIDRAGIAQDLEAFKNILISNYESLSDQLETKENLLHSFNFVLPLDLKLLFLDEEKPSLEATEIASSQAVEISLENEEIFEEEEIIIDSEPLNIIQKPKSASYSFSKRIDPSKSWEKFESENYNIMKGEAKELFENLGLNHRFMFTKDLFGGNPDLLKSALKGIENCSSFTEAVELLNERFVEELEWNLNSDAVEEFLQIIFRKFKNK